jgi:hypothetical protein
VPALAASGVALDIRAQDLQVEQSALYLRGTWRRHWGIIVAH